MKRATTLLSVTQLKQYLVDIKEHGDGVCVRFRSLGQMWQINMMRVVAITENRVLLNDDTNNKLISLDLTHVMQFEVDKKFKSLDPYYHYDVVPDQL